MKTPKRVPTKVQRIIETLSKMLASNANIIFSTMSITFFSGAIFKCIFREKNNLCFFDRRLISCLQEEKHHLYRIYRKNHISMYFLRNIIFHFSSRKDITFSRKRNAIFPDDTRNVPKHDFFGFKKIKNLNCVKRWFLHKPLIRIGITCKKIAFYMCDTDCWWHILKGAKIF